MLAIFNNIWWECSRVNLRQKCIRSIHSKDKQESARQVAEECHAQLVNYIQSVSSL